MHRILCHHFHRGIQSESLSFSGYYGQVRFIMGWGQKPKLFYHSKLYISALKSEICWGTSAITLLRGPIEIWGQLANTAWIIMGRMSLLWGGAPNQKCFYHSKLYISALKSEICLGTFAITSLWGPIEIWGQIANTVSGYYGQAEFIMGRGPKPSVFLSSQPVYIRPG